MFGDLDLLQIGRFGSWRLQYNLELANSSEYVKADQIW